MPVKEIFLERPGYEKESITSRCMLVAGRASQLGFRLLLCRLSSAMTSLFGASNRRLSLVNVGFS
jgi:hypothetical protein